MVTGSKTMKNIFGKKTANTYQEFGAMLPLDLPLPHSAREYFLWPDVMFFIIRFFPELKLCICLRCTPGQPAAVSRA